MAGPKFLGADVIGDSMMLRFSLRNADSIPNFSVYPRSWGLCKSGQTTEQLLRRQWEGNLHTGKRKAVLIMIGTNDVLQIARDVGTLAVEKGKLKHSLRKLLTKAVRKYKKVFFCTVPEVPQLEEDCNAKVRQRYKSLLTSINNDIVTFGERAESVTSVDLRGQFRRDCYERLTAPFIRKATWCIGKF